jgi:hypothetical protein
MMSPQRGECAVMRLMAVHGRLAEKAELQRHRMQQRRRYRARGVEQRYVVLRGRTHMRPFGDHLLGAELPVLPLEGGRATM